MTEKAHLPPYDPVEVAARRAALVIDAPWDQGERDGHGWDHRAPTLVRALERNRDAMRVAAASAPTSGTIETSHPAPCARGNGFPDKPGSAQDSHRATPRPEPQAPQVGRSTDLPPRDACHHWSDADGYCGATDNVTRYLTGPRCPRHTPAALAGHPKPVPDPTMTLDGLRAAAHARRVEAAKRRPPVPGSPVSEHPGGAP